MPTNQELGIRIQTAGGLLRAETHSDPNFPGLTIYWGDRQIAVIEYAAPFMRVCTWDSDKEDPSSVLPIFPGYGEAPSPAPATKSYSLPVTWQMAATLNIEAESLEAAQQIARRGALPNGEYVDDSFTVVEAEDQGAV